MISIIIPCYNQAHFLPDAILSSQGQTYPDIEIIVVNDGSTDNTSEIARRYNVTIIEQENKGLAAARNAGIREASGEWILPLDADDKIDPQFIYRTINRGDIVSVFLETFGNDIRRWKAGVANPIYNDFLLSNQLWYCSLYKKSMWETVGGYDEYMRDGYEDWDFWIRATKAGYKISVVREILFYYRLHGNSLYSHALSNHNKIIEYMAEKYPVNNFRRK